MISKLNHSIVLNKVIVYLFSLYDFLRDLLAISNNEKLFFSMYELHEIECQSSDTKELLFTAVL